MEEIVNLEHEDVMEILKNEFPLIPRRNKVIITVNVNDANDSQFEGESLSETQFVMAAGDYFKDIKPGMQILLDIERMMEFIQSDEDTHERVGQIKLKPIEVNGRMYAIITDAVIDAIDNRNL